MGMIPTPPFAACGICGEQPHLKISLLFGEAQLRCSCGVRGAWIKIDHHALDAATFGWPFKITHKSADDAVAALAKQDGFHLGQAVRVNALSPFYSDWSDAQCFIAGINVSKKGIDFTISEHWPPAHSGDLYDGWGSTHLSARPVAIQVKP